jgi:single-strand DNA-binding protein
MLNQCFIFANLGEDPRTFYNAEGLAVTSFNVAFQTSHRKKDPNWIRVTCFSKLAEVAAQYLHRGARVCICGALDQNKWTTENGETRNTFQILAHDIQFIKTDGRGFKEGESKEEVPF